MGRPWRAQVFQQEPRDEETQRVAEKGELCIQIDYVLLQKYHCLHAVDWGGLSFK